MEENTNFDLGTLYDDSKNQKTVQGDFSLKKTKKTKQNKKTQIKTTEHHYPHHSLLVFCGLGFFLFNKKAVPSP